MRGNVPKSKSSEIYAHVPRERQTRFVHSSQDGTLFEKTARLIGNVRSSTDRATVIESKDTRFGNDSTNFADKNVDAKVEDGDRTEERMEKLSVFRAEGSTGFLVSFSPAETCSWSHATSRNVEFLGYWELVFDKRNGYRIHDDHLPDFFQQWQFLTLVPIRIEN